MPEGMSREARMAEHMAGLGDLTTLEAHELYVQKYIRTYQKEKLESKSK